MASPPPTADLSAYSPPGSLWKLIENNAPVHEQEELKTMLGSSLVEQSLELRIEIEALLEIWRDYRNETDQVNQANVPMRLPEPPAARERLRQEISFFVNRIRERSSELERNSDHILEKHNTDVLRYAMEEKRPDSGGYYSRPSTAKSSTNGRETPSWGLCSPTSDRFSLTSSLSEEVESMSDKLNIFKLDEVTAHLRETLGEEIEYLMTDISFLQGCLEDEADFRSRSSMEMLGQEPTLSELRDERNKLEKELLESDSPIPMVLQDSPKRVTGFSPLPYTQALIRTQIPNPPVSAGRSRSRPLKASHSLQIAESPASHQTKDGPSKISRVRQPRPSSQEKQTARASNKTTPKGVTNRTSSAGNLPRDSRLVKVCSVPVYGNITGKEDAKSAHVHHVPSPPPAGKTGSRPSSADRFRKMVLVCRDQDGVPPVS